MTSEDRVRAEFRRRMEDLRSDVVGHFIQLRDRELAKLALTAEIKVTWDD